MRVALFTYGTQPRGGVVHTLSVAEALRDLGHEPCVFALDDTGRGFFREPRCPYVLVPIEARRSDLLASVRAKIDAYVAALRNATLDFDVFHAQDGISANALATLVEWGTIPKFARTIHHLDDFAQDDLATLQDRSVVSAAATFVVSGHWQRLVRKRYGIESTLVPNGVDLERFAPAPSPVRATLRARLDVGVGPLFVSIGGIEARKNTVRTLEAFALVRARRPDARLIIAGGASILNHAAYRRAFDTRAVELQLRIGDDVILAGVLADDAIVALLQAAHALVFPSLVEGFGLVLLEALACGTPVVTSAIAPFTEFLGTDDAQLVDPRDPVAIANAMLRALEPTIARRAVRRGPRVASRHTWRACAAAHAATYRDLAIAREECVRA